MSSAQVKQQAGSEAPPKRPSVRKPRAPATGGKSSAPTFVRVRPLLQHELQEGAQPLPGLVLESRGPDGESEKDAPRSNIGVNAMEGRLPIGGFTGVLGQHEKNLAVYEKTFRPSLSTVMRGGTAALFCYGYTGAGKTHTVFGVESDPGLYHLATSQLLENVLEHNQQVGDDDALILQASVVEVYNDSAYDLMDGRKECSLRQNGAGQLLVRGATTKIALDEEEAKSKGADFKVVTAGLTTIQVHSQADLNAIHERSKAHRAVGSSTEHDQSSRSHAIFRLEVVNKPMIAALATLEEAESLKPGVQTQFSKKPTKAMKDKLKELNDTIENTSKEIEAMYSQNPSLGGRLILVDLAGADSDSRDLSDKHSAMQRKESTAINKSLLALKEVLRGLHQQATTGVTKKLPFRDSSITRLLEEVLVPKKGRDTDSVMLVNVAPPSHLERKTLNSLRYGQMHASGSVGGA